MEGKTMALQGDINTLIDSAISKEAFDEIKDDISTIKDKLFEVKNPTQYIFVNKSLEMNPGKLAAQISHAQEEFFDYMLNHATKLESTFAILGDFVSNMNN